jgi:hypothetical protein
MCPVPGAKLNLHLRSDAHHRATQPLGYRLQGLVGSAWVIGGLALAPVVALLVGALVR